MKTLLFVAAALLLVIIGGGLTSMLGAAETSTDILPFLHQVGSADGSTLAATPDQSTLLFLLIGFLVFNLVGIALTLALVMWFLDRGVRISRSESESRLATTRAETEA